jgi:hypothetical protein
MLTYLDDSRPFSSPNEGLSGTIMTALLTHCGFYKGKSNAYDIRLARVQGGLK